jgi:hypothetical protein
LRVCSCAYSPRFTASLERPTTVDAPDSPARDRTVVR